MFIMWRYLQAWYTRTIKCSFNSKRTWTASRRLPHIFKTNHPTLLTKLQQFRLPWMRRKPKIHSKHKDKQHANMRRMHKPNPKQNRRNKNENNKSKQFPNKIKSPSKQSKFLKFTKHKITSRPIIIKFLVKLKTLAEI